MMTDFNIAPIPPPTQDDFKLWLEKNRLSWRNLDPNERDYITKLFQKQYKQEYETRIRKARPLLRKKSSFGNPQHQGKSPGKDYIKGNVHQRVVNEISQLLTQYPSLKLFFNVSAPKKAGTSPIIVLNGPTVSLIDIRMWDISRTYSIDPKYKVLQDAKFFPGGSTALPLMVKAWKTVFPKNTRVQGMIVLPYGEVNFQKNNHIRPPYTITDLSKMNLLIEKPTLQCDPQLVTQVDLLAATEILGRLNP